MEYFRVVLNGHTLQRGMSRREADAMAERWQGSHSGNSGLLRIKDRGDYVEVKHDREMEREFDERIKVAKAGDRQTLIMHERVD